MSEKEEDTDFDKAPRTCYRCGKIHFHQASNSWCDSCKKEYDRIYYIEHKEEIRKRHVERKQEISIWGKGWNRRLKTEVLSHYSLGAIPECVVCGEKRLGCLSLDHIENDGAKQRKTFGYSSGSLMYRWVKNNNYPKGFQTLCMNCQFLKREAN